MGMGWGWDGDGDKLVDKVMQVLMMVMQVRCTAMVSRIIGADMKRLLDKERDYVIASLARTAMDIKHSTKEEFGVDPETEVFKGGVLVFGK